ncbi:integrase arm-type DNA-binding domain-containing protein [Marivivens sp. JLT3646]|uniref:tyrosine-type recombinase/integrase n=1 Tax=Marivivens sp. JLT3646 TaxID=1920883 RepID=UPI0007FBA254|nr:integrase arm-type DNA-binding domain-containing protein [Marivivens sp. JLT3646]APO85658.1 integrase [Marivivens sp. JLT3646]OBR35588.1 integrase [Donghicola sp. JL3646]
MATKAGQHPQKALTARFVETVKDAGKYFDGHGLFLRVNKSGSKQWVQRLVINGKRTELGLGSPPAIPLSTARQRALENKGMAMMGGDPLAAKRSRTKQMTFTTAVEAYLEKKQSEFRNEKHGKQWRSTLETYAIPALGNKHVSAITVEDVLRVLTPIWAEKTETAKRLRGRIEKVLSWATVSGHRTGTNPAIWQGNLSELLPKPSQIAETTNQPAVAVTEISRWWSALSAREGMAAEGLRLLILTGARSGEIRGMTWDEIEFQTDPVATSATSATWTIPASRMKNRRTHRVPLSSEAITLLQRLPRLNSTNLVFFAPKGGKLSDMSISAVMRRIHEADIKSGGQGFLDPQSKRPAVPHGLRSTFRQWAAEKGYERDMTEIALAHFIGSDVERAYQRSDMFERRKQMMQDWAKFVLISED